MKPKAIAGTEFVYSLAVNINPKARWGLACGERRLDGKRITTAARLRRIFLGQDHGGRVSWKFHESPVQTFIVVCIIAKLSCIWV